MKPTKTAVKKELDKINDYSLVAYMQVLGFQPTAESTNTTTFRSPFADCRKSKLIVDHKTNRFSVTDSTRNGGVVDLLLQLFKITTEDILQNIVPFRLHQVKS